MGWRGRRRGSVIQGKTVRHMGHLALLSLLMALGPGLSPPTDGWWGGPQLAAQSIRVTGSTSVRYVEVRSLGRDSVGVDEVTGSGLLRVTSDGNVVRCVTGAAFCRGTVPGPRLSTVPVVQDLEASAWGLGQGVRLFTHLRGRTAWGDSPELWPRSSETLDVLTAYADLDREHFRVRAGRQWTTSGLGFYNFDGVSALARPLEGLSVEGSVGRSLVRGLNENRAGGALEAIEALAPEDPGLLLSAQLRYRPSSRMAGAFLYLRDVRDDRAGLYSELVRGEGVFRFQNGGSIEGSLEADLASGSLNEGRLRARLPPILGTAASVEVRRYRPYFELWTIWGAFSPMGFDEGRLDMTWARDRGALILRGEASYRSYEDEGQTTSLGSFRTNGWGVGASASWAPVDEWRMESGYRLEAGFGAARSEGHAGVIRQLGSRGQIAARAVAFQRIYEFRLDEGTVLGLGGEGSYRLSDRSRLFAGLTSYRHLNGGSEPELDWNQLRGSFRIQWTVGPEPGLSLPRSGGP